MTIGKYWKMFAIRFPLTSGMPVHHSVASNSNVLSSIFDPLQEFAVITRAVRAKVTKDLSEWCRWHFNFQQVVT